MNKLQEIFKAWNIAFDPNKDQSELAAKRIEICNSCDKKVTNLGFNQCSVCGCALKGKVFSPVKGACPEGKWDEIDGKEEITGNDLGEITDVIASNQNIKTKEVNNKVMAKKVKDKSIFVQIASYRDPELLNTLNDLFSKADHPDNLKVCIAWHHSTEDTWDTLDEYKEDSRVIILDIPYEESKGACWARNLIQQEYTNEAYTLQLDSHHRFIEGWDTEVIEMLESLRADGHEKPLLTGYIPSYNPENDPEGRATEPWWMTFDRFTPEGVVFFLPASIPGWKDMDKPVLSRFYSAHFAFTVGEFAKEVQHDPSFYFHGEEITIAVRAFTHGYDLFHPHKIIAWHEYTRKGRTKHWDDSKDWTTYNRHTHKKTRQLLGIDSESAEGVDFGIYGLGTKRTLEDYEKYAGIRFKDRGVQQFTLDNKFAPNPLISDEEEYANSFQTKFRHCIDIHTGAVPEDDYEFWAVIFEDENGKEIYRKDETADGIKRLKVSADKGNNGWINLWREYIGKFPYQWIVWPYSTSKGWCNKMTGVLKN